MIKKIEIYLYKQHNTTLNKCVFRRTTQNLNIFKETKTKN